ncbi:MAG: BON domain-containing protein [Halomonas sp.]|nr:BON domain-containing protein [Halomonas sp.]MDN6313965.1 BON domain-containing protein [Halomonas sp.]MDN6335492.1 BON domain-containing protein [Halomonas sp.]
MPTAIFATLRTRPVTRTCIAVLLAGGLLLLGGCATNSATNQSHYGQRTNDVQAIDATIEDQVAKALVHADARLGDARIRPHSFNGAVLLVGQVPSEELRDKAGQVAGQLRGVETVHNELSVAARLPTSQRLTDTWLTTNVIGQLATNDHIDSSKLKVTTENASVYLMGIVSRQEAERIVAAVSSVAGVQRIVKVFEYLDGAQG